MFINDLVESLTCQKLAYADDLKLFNRIDSYTDCMNLQRNIKIVSTWCKNHQLSLNVAKCNITSYHRIKNAILYNYTIDDISLKRSDSFKDLGIVFDEKFTFVPHIEQMITSASRMLGFLIRNSKYFNNVTTVKLLYYSFIRSKFDYGSIVWSPIYACHIHFVENIQRRFLKYLVYMEDGIYPVRGVDQMQLLSRFNELPLSTRRQIQSIKFLYKLLHNAIDCPFLLNEVSFRVPRIGSRHRADFSLDLARSNIVQQSPIYLMCSSFNTISNICDIYYHNLGFIVNSFVSTK